MSRHPSRSQTTEVPGGNLPALCALSLADQVRFTTFVGESQKIEVGNAPGRKGAEALDQEREGLRVDV